MPNHNCIGQIIIVRINSVHFFRRLNRENFWLFLSRRFQGFNFIFDFLTAPSSCFTFVKQWNAKYAKSYYSWNDKVVVMLPPEYQKERVND